MIKSHLYHSGTDGFYNDNCDLILLCFRVTNNKNYMLNTYFFKKLPLTNHISIISTIIIALTGIVITLLTVILCLHFELETTVTIAVIEAIATIVVSMIPVIVELINKKKSNSSIVQQGDNNDAKILAGSEGNIQQEGNSNTASIGNAK